MGVKIDQLWAVQIFGKQRAFGTRKSKTKRSPIQDGLQSAAESKAEDAFDKMSVQKQKQAHLITQR